MALRFEDPTLLAKIREALSTLYERQTTMRALGLNLGHTDDPLEESVILKEGFEFSWSGARWKKDPSVIMLDPEMRPILVVKADFAARDDFFDRIASVLPDFLAQKSTRQLVPRARWKEIWTAEPSNVVDMEQQLARLVEQALWAMVSDPAFKVEASPTVCSSEMEMEPWMEEHDARVKKTAERQKARKAKAPPALALVAEDPPAEPAVIASHYWRADARGSEELQESAPQPVPEPVLESRSVCIAEVESATSDSVTAAPAEHSGCPAPGPVKEPDVPIIFGSFGPASPPPSCDGDASPRALDVDDPLAARDSSKVVAGAPSEPTFPTAPCTSTWQPNQVVQYIWGQLAQPAKVSALDQSSDFETASSAMSTVTAQTPSYAGPGTPMRRGHWVSSSSQTPLGSERASFRAVIRNTFIDIDQRSECQTPGARTSRSLSPSLFRYDARKATEEDDDSAPNEDAGDTTYCEEGDTWYWYWR